MDDKLTLCIAVIAACIVLQTIILIAACFVMLKVRSRVEALAERVEDTASTLQVRVLPVIDNVKTIQQDVKSFIETSRPKVETFLDNLGHITGSARASVERIDSTVNDTVDRIRLQIIRGDEMLTRTMDRIEETSEKVQHTVMSPVRQASGFMHAISTGFGSYFNQQKRRRNGGPSDEMFI
jgi:methyl-accepting chemotaxis protein